jgi:hypothetical protein
MWRSSTPAPPPPVEVLLEHGHGAHHGSSYPWNLVDAAHIMAPANNTSGNAAMMLEEPLIRVSQMASKDSQFRVVTSTDLT